MSKECLNRKKYHDLIYVSKDSELPPKFMANLGGENNAKKSSYLNTCFICLVEVILINNNCLGIRSFVRLATGSIKPTS